MRIIKFRAWNKRKKTLKPVSKMELPIYLNLGSIQMFTGLYDRNQNEIYEGDIIESTILGVKFRGEVVWDTCCFRVTTDDLDITLGNDKADKRKVIGNVWQNPELLNNQT